ncbi:hypothetical protein C7212DRAFT_157020 [Tuber magnatum]|uniref:Uncharacterized protein n=1 Tax=Tuber magnatum TaxID=42249 RepID=A0A317SZ81_9PEZI|nr:hypothetical protein C7212DRAFT_157020 [Tuber magnatum]
MVVFQPLKYYHVEAIDQATRTSCSDFNKVEFLPAITSIRQQVFKRSTILSAFHKTGLILCNPDLVLSHLCECAGTFEPEVEVGAPNPSLRTPLPERILEATIPHTVCSLKCQADSLWHSNSDSPSFKHSLNCFIKGSIAQAHVGAQAQEDLEHTQAAELA